MAFNVCNSYCYYRAILVQYNICDSRRSKDRTASGSGKNMDLFTNVDLFRENLNASKPSEHSPSGGMSKDLGGSIGCRDKSYSWS